MLGDTVSAIKDREQADRLHNEIMLVIDVPVVSRQVTRYLGTTIETKPPVTPSRF